MQKSRYNCKSGKRQFIQAFRVLNLSNELINIHNPINDWTFSSTIALQSKIFSPWSHEPHAERATNLWVAGHRTVLWVWRRTPDAGRRTFEYFRVSSTFYFRELVLGDQSLILLCWLLTVSTFGAKFGLILEWSVSTSFSNQFRSWITWSLPLHKFCQKIFCFNFKPPNLPTFAAFWWSKIVTTPRETDLIFFVDTPYCSKKAHWTQLWEIFSPIFLKNF